MGVPRYKLEGYKRNDNPLSDVIGYWCDGNVGPVTWESIVAALKLTDAKGLADEIEAEYCMREPGIIITTHTCTHTYTCMYTH